MASSLTSQLSNLQRGVKRFGSVLAPANLLNGSLGGLAGQVASDAAPTGMSLDNMPFTGGVLNGFDFGFKRDAAGGAFGPMLQESYDPINARVVPSGRRYVALGAAHLGHADAIPPPGERQLALIYRTDPSSPNVRMDSGAVVMGDPVIAGTPATVNYAWAQQQVRWARDNALGYRHLTPAMIWFGAPIGDDGKVDTANMAPGLASLSRFAQYRGFALDGVVRITESSQGGAPMLDNGLQMRKGGGIFAGGISRQYDPTVVIKGQQQVFDYAEGRGLCEGARCYMVIKKGLGGQYLRPQRESHMLQYCLAEKDIDKVRDGMRMYRTIETPPIDLGGGHTTQMLPYQIFFVNVPDGGRLDPRYLEYTDEWGDRRYDGLAIEYGRVFAAPFHFHYLPPPEPEQMTPYMDGSVGLHREYFELLVNTDNAVRTLL